MKEWIAQACQCWKEDTPVPLISKTQPSLSMDEAYEIQKALLHAADIPTYGYKAALTSTAVQSHFGISSAISGVLIDGRRIQNSDQFAHAPGVKLETELGFFLSRAINEPANPENVMDSISTIAPVIEVARPYLAGPPSAVDLIASNSASYRYIVGDKHDPSGVNIDGAQVELQRDASTLHTAHAGTVMQGQRLALTWLINQILSLGQPLLPGQLLITGAIGDMHDGTSGSYCARYGELGEIHFAIS